MKVVVSGKPIQTPRRYVPPGRLRMRREISLDLPWDVNETMTDMDSGLFGEQHFIVSLSSPMNELEGPLHLLPTSLSDSHDSALLSIGISASDSSMRSERSRLECSEHRPAMSSTVGSSEFTPANQLKRKRSINDEKRSGAPTLIDMSTSCRVSKVLCRKLAALLQKPE